MWLIALLACTSATPSPTKLGIAIPSRVHAIAWIADESKLFSTPTEVLVMGGSSATMRGLVADTVQLGLAGGDALSQANDAGADLVVLAGFVNRHHHRLVVHPSITSPEQLKGHAVGLPFLGGPQDSALKVALEHLKLGYGTDVEVRNLGKEFNTLAALERGEIHGTLSALPTPVLEARGFEVLVDLPALDEPFPYAMLIADRTWLAGHRPAARAVLAGLCDATARYRTEEAARTIVDAHLLPANPVEANFEHQLAGPSTLSWPPVPDPRGFTTVDRLQGRAGGTLPVDLTILEALRDEGHCGGR